MSKIKISIVSYSNTIPFVHGIENSGYLQSNSYELYKDTPSKCFDKIKNNEADIGIIPVATIDLLDNVKIISDFCIGAENTVQSVILASNVPLGKIKKVFLDYQSRTSNLLTQVLAKFYWEKRFDFIYSGKGYEKKIDDNTAGIIIGDRAIELQHNYKYIYDLSEEWYKFTGLPFVFACWVKNKDIPANFLSNFNKALMYGINDIDKITSENSGLNHYLKKNIDYFLDERKKEAMQLFHTLANNL